MVHGKYYCNELREYGYKGHDGKPGFSFGHGFNDGKTQYKTKMKGVGDWPTKILTNSKLHARPEISSCQSST